jgi:tRNA(Ile)-lysidine synthase
VNWDALLEQLAYGLCTEGLLVPEAGWVIGVSGGADSTLLLHAMRELSERQGLRWSLHAGHLHHGLRGDDADRDAEFVARLAASLNVPLHSQRTDIAQQARESGRSTEEVARQWRYEFLERIALKSGCDLVAVAHHADDLAETVLHRICRGTGLRGLAGMPVLRPIHPGSRVRLVRPLLGQRRATIEALCRERGLEYRVDNSNATSEFTRGRIRNVVLPLMRDSINPNVTEALLRLAEQARWLGVYLEDAAARTFESLVISESPGRVVLNTRGLLSKQRIIQAEVVRKAISLVAGGEQDLSFHHIESVLKLAADRGSGRSLHLPGPALVRKQYDRLEFGPLTEPRAQPEELVPVFVACPGRTELPLLGMLLTVEVCPVSTGGTAGLIRHRGPHEEWVDFDRVHLPLLVRSRRDGDRFWPLGAPGSKSVSDFLSDEKIDPALRSRTGVLCDQRGPIWVMPMRIDERVKLRETTGRALRLSLGPISPASPDAR